MRQRIPPHRGPKLPHILLEQVRDASKSGQSGRHNGPANRKERRKAEREAKKASHAQEKSRAIRHKPLSDSNSVEEEEDWSPAPSPPLPSTVNTAAKPLRSILKKKVYVNDPPPLDKDVLAERPISRAVKDKLAEDDAEIATLERKLGLKGKKTLPKAFYEEGLGGILDGLEDDGLYGPYGGKRKRREDEAWLESKRRKATTVRDGEESETEPEDSELGEGGDLEVSWGGNDAEFEDEDEEYDEDMELDEVEENEEVGFNSAESGEEDDFIESDRSDPGETPQTIARKSRENPYVPPVSTDTAPVPKYIPPSLRGPPPSDAEALTKLRRQLQGLLNRLSDANLISILRDVEQIYQLNPRQYVSSTLIDLLINLVCDRTSLADTFIILHAGFIAAVYKVTGTDFGAQLLERVVSEFDDLYAARQKAIGSVTKEVSNLISLVAQMYVFQVVGSNLVFDYIRLFLESFSDLNTELLLKIIKASGSQLRQDDPSSLKDIVILLQKAVAKTGESNLPVRTKFMIETINNLKNNKMKTGAAASAVISEHTLRMKKTLGSLSARNLKASEPLRVGLKDIKDTEKKGKWWLVGASWKNENEKDHLGDSLGSSTPAKTGGEQENGERDGVADLLQLAREQRMNTDVRRAIFITIMSATDFKDAHFRLLKLRLKKTQESEIARVLVHCAGAEQMYNPYYTLIARRLCADRKLRKAFQYTLWDLFRRLGEENIEDSDLDGGGDETEDISTRRIVNLAKLYGSLIADDGLTLAVLKILNYTYLQAKSRIFVEILMITVILESQKRSSNSRDEKALLNIVMNVKDAPEMATGLQFFLNKVVCITDIAGSKQERETIRWGCRVAGDALTVITSGAKLDEE